MSEAMGKPVGPVPTRDFAFAPVDLGDGTHAELDPGPDRVWVGIYSNNNFDTPLTQHTFSYEGYEQFRHSYPKGEWPKLTGPGSSPTIEDQPKAVAPQGKGSALPVVRLVPNVVAARLYTSNEGPQPDHSPYQQAGDEAWRVLEKHWEDTQQTARTLWEALPGTSDESTTQAARERIVDGALDTLKGIATLAGPPPDLVLTAALTGDPTLNAQVQEMRDQQQQAVQAIGDSIKNSWDEAKQRNGTVGAVSMAATTLAVEALGGKGTDALASGARHVAHLPKKLPGSPRKGKDGFVVIRKEKPKRLPPNHAYTSNGYHYTTDAKGRIKTAEGELRLEKGKRDTDVQRKVGKKDGRLEHDDGGHLIAARFGGSGGLENLTPMDRFSNRWGAWRKMEDKWENVLKKGGTVKVKIELVYSRHDTIRATHFKVTETTNGVKKITTIPNG